MSKCPLPLLLLICLSLLITGCQTAANTQPTAAPDVVTIEVDGELIVLIPGENVAPELNELVRTNPEFAAGVEWVLINDIWEPIARGVERVDYIIREGNVRNQLFNIAIETKAELMILGRPTRGPITNVVKAGEMESLADDLAKDGHLKVIVVPEQD